MTNMMDVIAYDNQVLLQRLEKINRLAIKASRQLDDSCYTKDVREMLKKIEELSE